jgi:hypothetical protein
MCLINMSFLETICYFGFMVKNLSDGGRALRMGERERAFCKKLSIYKR